MFIKSLSVCLLNVYGQLQSKLENPDFLNYINDYDILIFNESWGNKNSVYKIEGYQSPFVKYRNKRRGAKRDSGGVACFYKNHIKEGISEIFWSFEDGVIVKLDKSFFSLENHVFLVCPYLSPSNSTRNAANSGIEVFDMLADKISELRFEGDVCLIGDLNSRIANFNFSCTPDDIDDRYISDLLISDGTIFTSDLEAVNFSLERTSKDTVTNEYGRNLIQLMQSTQMICLNGIAHNDKNVGNFTYSETRGNKLFQSVVDYVICSKGVLSSIENFTVHNSNIHSDHVLLSFDLKCNIVKQSENKPSVCSRHTKKVWKENLADQFIENINSDTVSTTLIDISNDLRQCMSNTVSQSTDVADTIRQNVLRICDILNSAGENHVATHYYDSIDSRGNEREYDRELGRGNNHSTKSPWYDKSLQQLRAKFKKAESNHNVTQSVADKVIMCKLRNSYRKMCRLRRRSSKMKEADSLVSLIKTNSREFWKKIKKKRKNKVGDCDFVKYFKELSNLKSSINSETQSFLNASEQKEKNVSVEVLDQEIIMDELETAIKSLKSNKASGIDGIINEFIRFSPSPVKEAILLLFNAILQTGCFPEIWAKGEIVPVYKKGNINDPSNFRGIFLISCLGKVFSSILNSRLNEWAESNDIFCNNQFGFRKEKSVTDCIFTIHGLIEHFLSNSTQFFCSFVDLKKAFDFIDRRCLWYKLDLNGVSSKLINLIKDMYGKIKLRVRQTASSFLKNKNSNTDKSNRKNHSNDENERNTFFENEDFVESDDFFTSTAGVFQGESLSPFLFSMYLNDLDTFLKDSEDVGVQLDYFLLTIIMFADDMVLFSKTRQGLQNALDALSKYCSLWGMSVNTSKTKCMAFKNGGKISKLDTWTYENAKLETVNKFKYLGFILSSSGKFAQSIAAMADQGRVALFNMKTSLNCYADLDLKTKLKLFNCFISPVIENACEVWGFCKADKLDTLYLGFLKSILGVRKSIPSVFIYRELNLYPLKLNRYIRIFKYWLKIKDLHTNNPVKAVYNMLKNDYDSQPDVINWVSLFVKLLNESGLGYIWTNQNNLIEKNSYYIALFKDRIQDIILQEFNSDLDNVSNNRLYKHLDHDFYGKDYLRLIKQNHLRVAISRFRLGSHNFMIERGRWTRPITQYTHRLCKTCDELEDEMHVFLECQRYNVLRRKYLPSKLYEKPSMFKFIDFLQKADGKILSDLAIFCSKVLKDYDENQL